MVIWASAYRYEKHRLVGSLFRGTAHPCWGHRICYGVAAPVTAFGSPSGCGWWYWVRAPSVLRGAGTVPDQRAQPQVVTPAESIWHITMALTRRRDGVYVPY